MSESHQVSFSFQPVPVHSPAEPPGLQSFYGEFRRLWSAPRWWRDTHPGGDQAGGGGSGRELEAAFRLSGPPRGFLSAHWLPLLLHKRIALQLLNGERYQHKDT